MGKTWSYPFKLESYSQWTKVSSKSKMMVFLLSFFSRNIDFYSISSSEGSFIFNTKFIVYKVLWKCSIYLLFFNLSLSLILKASITLYI